MGHRGHARFRPGVRELGCRYGPDRVRQPSVDDWTKLQWYSHRIRAFASPKTLGLPIDNCRRQHFNAQELFHELFLSLQPLDFTMITTPTVALPLLVIVLSQTLVRLTCTMPRESDSDAIRYALGAIPGNAPSLRTLRVDSYGSSSGFELSDHQMPYLHALSLGFKTASLCQQFAPVDATAALTSPKLEFTDNSDVVFHKTILRSFLCCSA